MFDEGGHRFDERATQSRMRANLTSKHLTFFALAGLFNAAAAADSRRSPVVTGEQYA